MEGKGTCCRAHGAARGGRAVWEAVGRKSRRQRARRTGRMHLLLVTVLLGAQTPADQAWVMLNTLQ